MDKKAEYRIHETEYRRRKKRRIGKKNLTHPHLSSPIKGEGPV